LCHYLIKDSEADSDDEDGEIKVDDDELYDESEDDKHEAELLALDGSRKIGEIKLSCPCCFSILCTDCQRHEQFKTQWRAMFVQNCSVERKTKLQTSEGGEFIEEKEEEQIVSTVSCTSCGASVGVQDMDEVYHFFSVIPSL
jgi:hypothetical protein